MVFIISSLSNKLYRVIDCSSKSRLQREQLLCESFISLVGTKDWNEAQQKYPNFSEVQLQSNPSGFH